MNRSTASGEGFHPAHELPAAYGTYVLLLRLGRARTIRIGRLGTCTFMAGCYLYVGSAFGPGGLRARIGHHIRRTDRPHWQQFSLWPGDRLTAVLRTGHTEEKRFVVRP